MALSLGLDACNITIEPLVLGKMIEGWKLTLSHIIGKNHVERPAFLPNKCCQFKIKFLNLYIEIQDTREIFIYSKKGKNLF